MSVTTDERLLIDGDWIEGGDGGYEIVNPATEAVVGVAPQASVQKAQDAAAAARDAVQSSARTTPEHRAELLKAAADPVRPKNQGPVPPPVAPTRRATP